MITKDFMSEFLIFNYGHKDSAGIGVFIPSSDIEFVRRNMDRWYSQGNTTTEIFTSRELGRFLKVGHTAIYQMVAARQIPFVRVGRQLRFPKDEILKWMERKQIFLLECQKKEQGKEIMESSEVNR